MSTEELVLKYISACEQVLKELQTTESPECIDSTKVKEIVEYAHAYLKDAKYYRQRGKFDVSLTSVAYCEGLLDALRLLGTVKFEWPKATSPRAKKRR
jgi:FAD synthetase